MYLIAIIPHSGPYSYDILDRIGEKLPVYFFKYDGADSAICLIPESKMKDSEFRIEMENDCVFLFNKNLFPFEDACKMVLQIIE